MPGVVPQFKEAEAEQSTHSIRQANVAVGMV